MGEVIQLSDQLPSEARISAVAFLNEVEVVAVRISASVHKGDGKGVLREVGSLLHMVEVGREEADRLTLRYGDDAA